MKGYWFGQFIYDHNAEEALSEVAESLGQNVSGKGWVRISDDQWSTKFTTRSSLAVPNMENGLHTSVDLSQSPDEGVETHFEGALAAMKQVYEATDPLYGYGIRHTRLNVPNAINSPTTREAIADNQIVAPTWLMLFTPEMVEEYGRDWLLDLPADRFEDLSDGGLMIICTEHIASTSGEGKQFLDDMAEIDRVFGLDPVETFNKPPRK